MARQFTPNTTGWIYAVITAAVLPIVPRRNREGACRAWAGLSVFLQSSWTAQEPWSEPGTAEVVMLTDAPSAARRSHPRAREIHLN